MVKRPSATLLAALMPIASAAGSSPWWSTIAMLELGSDSLEVGPPQCGMISARRSIVSILYPVILVRTMATAAVGNVDVEVEGFATGGGADELK